MSNGLILDDKLLIIITDVEYLLFTNPAYHRICKIIRDQLCMVLQKSDIDSRLLAIGLSYTHFGTIGPMVHEIYTKGKFELQPSFA